MIVFSPFLVSAVTVDIMATVPGCGDNIIENDEECDGSDLGGASCLSRGFSGGVLSCTSACVFNTSACTTRSFGGSSGSIGNGWIFSSIPSIIVNQNGIITSGIPSGILNIISSPTRGETSETENVGIEENKDSHLFDIILGPAPKSTESNDMLPAILVITLATLISLSALLVVNRKK